MKKIEMNPRVLGAMGDDISREMYQKRVAYGNGEQEAIESIVNLVWGGGRAPYIYAEKPGLSLCIWGRDDRAGFGRDMGLEICVSRIY